MQAGPLPKRIELTRTNRGAGVAQYFDRGYLKKTQTIDLQTMRRVARTSVDQGPPSHCAPLVPRASIFYSRALGPRGTQRGRTWIVMRVQ